MARDGAGTYTFPVNSFNPAVAATDISPTDWNSTTTDVATALTASIAKDGQTPTTAVIPFATGITLSGGSPLSTYATGTWVPADASGAGLTLTVAANSAKYVKIGKLVFAVANITYPPTADTNTALISGLPFTADSTANAPGTMTEPSSFLGTKPFVLANTQTFRFDATAGSVLLTNANLTTVNTIISLIYIAAS